MKLAILTICMGFLHRMFHKVILISDITPLSCLFLLCIFWDFIKEGMLYLRVFSMESQRDFQKLNFKMNCNLKSFPHKHFQKSTRKSQAIHQSN